MTGEWYEKNPESEEDPTFVFPIEVTLEDGSVVSIESEEELDELFEHCYGDECPWDGRVITQENNLQAAAKAVTKPMFTR